ncbi:MAG: DNA primase, partial [bacterium]
CGAGGNVFTFLMRNEGVTFPETVKFLAQRAGIELEFEEADDSHKQENEALYYVNDFAAQYFQEILFEKSGQTALQYLRNRGLSTENIKSFGLGYAPAGWDNLVKRAISTSNDLEVLHRAGLILKKDGGEYYDRFRDRVMFPILNLSGRVVAFGGRNLSDRNDSPKYINSPETAVYEKGKMLYGLFQNRDAIRKSKKAIFVEGYMDLLSLLAKGVENVVATLGTSMTEQQARLALRYTREVVLMYDSDAAGVAASTRGADILLEAGLTVFVADLPEGHDPDSLIREKGAPQFLKQVESAANLFDYKLTRLLSQPTENRNDEIRSLLDSLAKVKDNIQRSLLLTRVAERLGISEKILWSELQTILRQRQRSQTRQSEIAQRVSELSAGTKVGRDEKATRDLIRILLHDWSLANYIFTHLDFKALSASKLLPVLQYLKKKHQGGGEPSEAELTQTFNEVETLEFIVQVYEEDWQNSDLERWATDCLLVIHRGRIQKEIETIREQIRLAQGSGEPVGQLLHQCMELEAQKKMPLEQH